MCSLRDILVNQRAGQLAYDERVCQRANHYFDAVMVHADPSFARLEETFRPRTALAVPVHYTGFVAPGSGAPPEAVLARLLVSSGGGMVGEPLVRAAVEAHGQVFATTGLRTTVIAGPFLPDSVWTWLQQQGTASPHLDAIRRVDDLCLEMRRSTVTLSQGGYNTTMDILRAGTPAVVVPFSEGPEDEQRRRTTRLESLGLLQLLAPEQLTTESLVAAIIRAADGPPAPMTLDLDGAAATAELVAGLASCRPSRSWSRDQSPAQNPGLSSMITGARASTWLDPMRAALDSSDHCSPIFFRDDDAGRDDAGLSALLHVFDRHGLPLDLAVIPAALSESLAGHLRARAEDGSARLHQHGYAHLNHESAGRKHEFGPSREAAAQQSDIARGRSLLQEAFDAALDPVFTPPWNRCTRGTADILVALGFEVLSRDHTATGFDRPDLHEVPVTVDWFGHRSGVRWTRGELARRLAEGVANGGAVGVMLHHAISDVEDRAAIGDLLRLVAGHGQARATTILKLSRWTRPASVRGGVPAGPEADRDL